MSQQISYIYNVSNSEVRQYYTEARGTAPLLPDFDGHVTVHAIDCQMSSMVALNSSSILRICGGLQRLMAWRTDEGKTPENVFFCNECRARRCHTCNCLQEDHDFVFDCHEAFHVILTSM